jgi:hypothetical protein
MMLESEEIQDLTFAAGRSPRLSNQTPFGMYWKRDCNATKEKTVLAPTVAVLRNVL